MSAILVVLNRNNRPVSVSVVEAMLAASQERAVDGQDTWAKGHVALAHQHFRITPEEAGEQQPLVAGEGRTILCCDARLDNRDAILARLGLTIADGQGPSDAALILSAYERWGPECVTHLLGSFCFAVWDADRQQLLAAVDPLGARSLCTYVDDQHCLVASEISSLLAHPGVEPRLNEGRVADLLVGLWNNHEETFYEGLSYLPPAHCLLVTADSVRRWRYWEIDPEARIRCRTDGEYAEHYLELLREAVRCRLRATGAVGLSLSGGLDSSALAALSATLLPEAQVPQKRLRTFSYVFDELKSCDERQYIQPLVDWYQLEPTYIPCDDKWTLRDVDRWPVDRGFVLSDPYAWLPEAVMAAAQESGCRVLLGGYFGDVLFVGSAYWAAEMARELRWRELGKTLARHASDICWRSALWDYGLRALVPRGFRQAYRRLNPRRVVSIHPGLHPDFVSRTGLQERFATSLEEQSFPRPGQWARYRSLSLSVFSQGAAAVRKAYNRHGLELETPYWDRRLVEFVMALPVDQLGRPHMDRWIHRNAMSALLPETVRKRRHRTSFLPLLEKGLLLEEKETVKRILTDPEIVRRGMVRAEWLEGILARNEPSFPDWGFLWLCISLELWLERFW